jgi:hypothetical protein
MADILSPKVVLALLFIAIALEIATLLIYMQIDNLVNVELYNYGLQFSGTWIVEYGFNYTMALAFLFFAPIAMAFTLMPYHLYSTEDTKAKRWACILFPLISAALLAASTYYILQVDNTINVTLYDYGLQLNLDWYAKYLSINGTTLITTATSITIAFIMSTLTWIITRD